MGACGKYAAIYLMLVVVVDGIVRGAAADGASAKGKWIAHFTNGTGKTELAVPKEFVITNDTLDSVLYNLATERGEFLFTSFFLPTGDDNASAAIDVLKNFCSFVSKAGALRHLLILTHDARTWAAVSAELPVPVYLDASTPPSGVLKPEGGSAYVAGTSNTLSAVARYWFAWQATRLGYAAAFAAPDVAFLRDPFYPFREGAGQSVRLGDGGPTGGASFDVQFLSDWNGTDAPVPGGTLNATCPRFALVADKSVPLGSIVEDINVLVSGTLLLPAHVPCANTELWYAAPSTPTVAFLSAIAHRLIHPASRHQTHAAAVNEAATPFLWGSGHERPLRLRLLPHALAAHLDAFDARKRAGLPRDPVALRDRSSNQTALDAHSLWSPKNLAADEITRELATAVLAKTGGVTVLNLTLHAVAGAVVATAVFSIAARAKAGAFGRRRAFVFERPR